MANNNDNNNENIVDGINNESRLIEKTMEDVLHDSMIPYSEYVILDRALPRVEDGLKPVQRRILYSMNELGVTPDKPYKKSARIVGDCLGKYHPHGDSSIYQAMVRMAQDFSMGVKLVDGHGNYGSIDGDGAAAMRYTEARLAPLALELLRDLDKNTVKWSCNFDDTTKEPDYLPGRFPNLLVNGASGIAVGLATNIPPHNINEAISGVIAYIDKPAISLGEMMKIIKGPDFPSGGYLIENELVKAYETGRGKVILRAKVHFESGDNDKKLIVIDELPYQVNKAALLETILKIREEKKGVLAGISEIADESDRSGMRAVIRVKKDFNAQEILEALFKSANLQTTFGINMVAIAGGKPQQMGLLDIIAYYVDYQREVIFRRTKFELEQVKERIHILEGLVIAVRNIDEVIKIIKTSQNTTEARDRLRKRFGLTERQAQAILDLRLARLTHLEIFKLEKELEELRELMVKLTKILGSKKLQMEVVKSELMQIMRAYKETRKTQIIKNVEDFVVENEVEERVVEDSIVTISVVGDIKRMTIKNYSMATKNYTENSSINEVSNIIIRVNMHEKLLCFTNLGNCYKASLEDIPESKWRERGTKIAVILPDLLIGEKIIFIEPIGETIPEGNLLFYTNEGMVKKTAFSEYNLIKSSFQAIKLKDNDEVLRIEFEKPDSTLLFVTEKGMCLNADMSDIPVQGRISGGVKGIQLSSGDSTLFVTQIGKKEKDEVITLITNIGLCKNVKISEIEVMARYRKGIKIIDLTKSGSNGRVIFARITTSVKTLIVQHESGELVPYKTDTFKTESRIHSGRPLTKGKISLTTVHVYNDDFIKG